jgi:hypothetical protein
LASFLEAGGPNGRLCGHASAHFGDARDAEVLHRICRAHTGAHADAGDLLGTWLLNDRRS